MFKKILGAFFTIWGGFIFISSMLIFILPIWVTGLLPEPARTIWVIRFCRIWMGIFFPLTGIRLSIQGRKNFIKGENYIVVCNHNSLMDVPLTSPGIPKANKTIAKIEMASIPIFGIIYKRGSVLLDRSSDASRKQCYHEMKQVLSWGLHMCIYPEGTRNKSDNPLKSFHEGAFRLSFDTGKSIIPCIIRGTREMLPHNRKFYFWPGKASMQFLPAVHPSDFSDAKAMKEHIFQLMWNELSHD